MSQSLNHEIDNEFPPVDEKVATPTPKPVDNSQVKDQELFGKTPILGELPELQVAFDLSQTNLDKTTDILEMNKALTLSGGVSVEDAQALDALVPGFINDDAPAGYYSQEKSKTMYEETLLSLNAVLDTQLEQLNGTTADLAKQVITAGNRALERLKSAEIENLVRLNKSVLGLLLATGNDTVDCVRLILNNKERWREFANVDLNSVMYEYPLVNKESDYRPDNSELDVPYKGTLVEEYVRKVCTSLRATNGGVRRNLYALTSKVSDRLYNGIGEHVFSGERFALRKQDSNVVDSMDGKLSIVALVGALGDNTLRDWLANINVSIIAEIQTATQVLEKTAAFKASEDNNLDADVRGAAELATALHQAYANILANTNSACDVLEVYCATADLIDKVTEMQ